MANRIGLGKMVARHSLQGILQSAGAGLLTVSGTGTADFLTGGQALERIWLTLTRLGISLQPMTAITLFWLRWQMEGDKNFQEKHRSLLAQAWETYQGLFPGTDLDTEGHIMLFRFGFAPKITTGTYRKILEGFISN